MMPSLAPGGSSGFSEELENDSCSYQQYMWSLEHMVDEKEKMLKYCEISQKERKQPEEKSLRTVEQVHAHLVISIRQRDWDADR